MREYYFPSGVPVASFDVSGWITAAEVAFAGLLIIALIVLVVRCFRQASLWDLVGWVCLLVIPWIVVDWAAYNFLDVYERLGGYLALMFLLVLIATNVTVCRYFSSLAARCGFVLVEIALFCGLSYPAIREPTYSAVGSRCRNYLKQIGLAMHNYHDVHGAFPPAGHETDVFTWRIALLPYLDQQLLHEEFHFDEPWNSPHNASLQQYRPDVYHCPSHPAEKRLTSYAMLRGSGTVGGDGAAGMSIQDILDGTSNTLLVVEACGREIVWTEPKDVQANDEALGVNLPGDLPGRSRGAISSYHRGRAGVLLGDGSVRELNDKTDPNVIKALSTTNGGERTPQL